MHFINHSDQELVILKHSYVGAMKKVRELDQDMLINMHYLNMACQKWRQRLCNILQENSGVFGSSIADLTSTPLVKHYIDTGNGKPIKQRAYWTSHHHRKEIEKQKVLQNGIIEPSVSSWTSPAILVRKADKTLRFCIDYWSLNKTTTKDSCLLPQIQDTLGTLMVATCPRPLTS